MSEETAPPDDWGGVPPGDGWRDNRVSTKGKGKKAERPQMSAAAEDLRSMWIAAVRAYHSRRGHQSRYNSSPHWDGGYDSTTKRTKNPVWPGLLEKADEIRIPVSSLVRTLFEHWTSDSAPTPYALFSPENIRRARSTDVYRRRAIENGLVIEESLFRAGVWGANQSIPDPDGATKFVLNDMSRELTPLFRYSVAVLRNYQDVAARWEKAATDQFEKDADLYRTYWRSVLPQRMLAPAVAPAGRAS